MSYIIKYFMKLNIVSILYALLLFILIEFQVNIYRMVRITGLDVDQVNTAVTILSWVLFLLVTGGCIWLTSKWLRPRILNFSIMLLWLPYFYLMITVFARLFPLTNPAESPLPAIGIIILAMIFLYPLYIGLITWIGSLLGKKTHSI
ncbi:hypothetical protein [Paenibacillus sp. Marseille-Q7038]